MLDTTLLSFITLLATASSAFVAPTPAQKGIRLTLHATRRDVFSAGAVVAARLFAPEKALASTGPEDGNLPDLPPEAVRSYLQYR